MAEVKLRRTEVTLGIFDQAESIFVITVLINAERVIFACDHTAFLAFAIAARLPMN
ncbi:uncharacterized protein MYCFIDRAFT_169524 [Pseudocercospora fijiensis CIRAD86]|uniref:Uncharacterized protein n=1 Tax=Pseudocercospora fijiensis (strain CIRAD86) TaxID=383855 RepID=N1Q7U2_PSEFD|nr:uncharacterized protein MYCFIDRAFT_169524 [Pseudocercospora fijiensis CIRAD86]EME87761.1 hypothetical protein MYCFIDRAFT_169524 [Pseudocercospora fijiensis CIRAD86]